MIKVFYDGKCGLCSKEIAHYRKIAPQDTFDWVDVTKFTKGLNKHGVAQSEALKFLHALDSNDQLHIGVDAFILIWQQLKRWRILAKLISLPMIRIMADFIYKQFSQWRFQRLAHCKIEAK